MSTWHNERHSYCATRNFVGAFVTVLVVVLLNGKASENNFMIRTWSSINIDNQIWCKEVNPSQSTRTRSNGSLSNRTEKIRWHHLVRFSTNLTNEAWFTVFQDISFKRNARASGYRSHSWAKLKTCFRNLKGTTIWCTTFHSSVCSAFYWLAPFINMS